MQSSSRICRPCCKDLKQTRHLHTSHIYWLNRKKSSIKANKKRRPGHINNVSMQYLYEIY